MILEGRYMAPVRVGKYLGVWDCLEGRQVLEHRAVWEEYHGPIPNGYEIHHINGDKHDNRIENLELVTRGEHMRRHAGWTMKEGVWFRPCTGCGELLPLDAFYRRRKPPHRTEARCKPCQSAYKLAVKRAV